MAKNQKLFLCLLAVLVAIYSAVVVYGLTGEDSQTAQQQPAWTAKLNAWFGRFAPRLKLDELHCHDRPVAEYFDLSSAQPQCVLDLSPGLTGEHDFWKTELVMSPKNQPKPAVYFLAKYPPPAPERPAPRIPSDCRFVDEAAVAPPGWLSIELTPEDEEEIDRSCWLKADSPSLVNLTVVGPAELKLTCVGCNKDNQKRIQLRFEP